MFRNESSSTLAVESFEQRSGNAATWFALYTTCRHEKRVSEHLGQREIEHFLPLYIDHRKWSDGSRVALRLPLFPGYLFVRIDRGERSKVLSVPGALAIVGGTGKEPASLPDSAIEALRKGIEQRRVEPHALVTVGRQVRIHSGPFSGMSGIVTRKKNGLRIVLTLQQIMQSIAVEVDASDLELTQSDGAEPDSRDCLPKTRRRRFADRTVKFSRLPDLSLLSQ